MTLLPVIERELRTVARQSLTYSLRVIGVAALLAVCGFIGLDERMGEDLGRRLFGSLHTTLFVGIWVFVPLLAADCISRERREGTLALLFLTPLKPRDIVLAKGMVHGLRALTLWLAALPVLTIPFIAGGVSWKEAVLSLLVNASSLALAMAAGLVASARSKSWTRALAGASFLSACYCLLFLLGLSLVMEPVVMASLPSNRSFEVTFGSLLEAGIVFAVGWEEVWPQMLSGAYGAAAARAFLWTFLGVAALSFLSLFLLVRFTAWVVKRVWHEEPPSTRVLWLKEKFCRPVMMKGILRRWMCWELNRNPIGWLEQRTWSGRLVMWSWFAIFISIYSTIFANFTLYQNGFERLQVLLSWLLIISLAVSASGSFRRERESGVLELLLVAPLHEWQIIGGRVRGLWSHFVPSLALLFGVWLYCAGFLTRRAALAPILFYAVIFATLPVIGLYFSLAKTGFMSALAWTVLVGIIVPTALARFENALPVARVAILIPLLLASFFGWRLYSNLKRRRFALQARPS